MSTINKLRLLSIAGVLLVNLNTAVAVPPPDFIVNAGMQLYQAVAIGIFFCSTGFAALYTRVRCSTSPLIWKSLIGLTLIGAVAGIFYLFS